MTTKTQRIIAKALKDMYFPVNQCRTQSLFAILSRQPMYGAGAIVRPIRYAQNNYPSKSYFKVVYSNLDPDKPSKNGEVFAFKWHDGKLIHKTAEPKIIVNAKSDEWEIVQRPESGNVNKFIEEAKKIIDRRLLRQAKNPNSSTLKEQ